MHHQLAMGLGILRGIASLVLKAFEQQGMVGLSARISIDAAALRARFG